MVVVDILCIYSCVKIIISYRSHRKVYFILKSESLPDRLAVYILSHFGWEFIQLDYNLGPKDSRFPYIDIQTDLIGFTKENVEPSIKNEIYKCKNLSDYEKKRLSAYIAFLEKGNLYQKIEILHILELLKNQIGKPDVVMLYWSRWKDAISRKYADKGYNISFYRIYFLTKLQHKRAYHNANLVKEIINHRGFWNLYLAFCRIILDVCYCAYLGILKHIRSDVPKEIEKFDICVIVPGYKRTAWFNDLHWRRVKDSNKYRTLAIVFGRLEDSTYFHCRHLAERWISLGRINPSPYLYSVLHWLWPIFPQMLFRNIFKLVRDVLGRNISLDYAARILLILIEVSKLEALFKKTNVRLFWSSIEGNHLQSLAGTIAINRLRGISLGSTASAYAMPTAGLQNRCINDVFFVWGFRHADIFKQSKAVFKSMIISGYPGDDGLKHYLAKAIALRKKWEKQYSPKLILCFYDNAFDKDDAYSFYETLDYIHNLFHWVVERSKILLVIKSKRQEIFDTYPLLITELIKELENQQRVVYEFEVADLAPGFAADVVLGLGLSTLPGLIATYGKRVISFDCNRFSEKWPIGTDNIIFLKKPGEIVRILDNLTGEFHEKNFNKNCIEIKPIPNKLYSFADGKSAERISAYISSLIEDLSRGSNSEDAMYNANRIYSNHWGSDKVIEADEY